MTGIGWADFTGNGWAGCSRIPAAPGAKSGCEICYAETFCRNRLGVAWGPGAPRKKIASFRARMLRLNRLAKLTGLPFAVFSMSLADWLDAEIAPAWRSDWVDVIEETPELNYLVLTHRPHLIRKLAPASWRQDLPRNIWPGVTVDHRLHARRWAELADWWAGTGRAWVSAEPLASSLAGIEFEGACTVIVGGASNTRDPAWALDPAWLPDLVERFGERLYFKQWGVWLEGRHMDKKRAGRELDGLEFDHTAWPRHRSLLAAARLAQAAA